MRGCLDDSHTPSGPFSCQKSFLRAKVSGGAADIRESPLWGLAVQRYEHIEQHFEFGECHLGDAACAASRAQANLKFLGGPPIYEKAPCGASQFKDMSTLSSISNSASAT